MSEESDRSFAEELVSRLNKLCDDEAARSALEQVIEIRTVKVPALCDHPSVQVGPGGEVGMLGLLNGLAGVRSDQWGYVVAHADKDTGRLLRFSVDTSPDRRAEAHAAPFRLPAPAI